MLDSSRLNSLSKELRDNIGAAVIAAGVVFICLFAGLGAVGLLGPDEPRYAWIARAMAETGDWITPRLYGQPWFEKPILYYWAAALGFRLHLSSEVAARLPSAMATLTTALAIGWLGWKHYGVAENFRESPALLAPLIFSSSVAAIGFSRAATPDMLFSACIALAMVTASGVLRSWGLLRAVPKVVSGDSERENLDLAFFGIFLGLAVLAKGPAAVILAGGAIGLWALSTSQWRPAFRLLHPIAIGSFCVVALPWYVLCAARNPDFLRVFIFQHNFERYLTPVFQHRQPFWFLGSITLLAMLPWTVLLISAGQEGVRLWREKSWGNSPGCFYACWAIFPIIFFSLSQSKLPGYILPAIPPLALLCAVSIPRVFRGIRRGAIAVSLGLGLVWIALSLFLFHMARKFPLAGTQTVLPLIVSKCAIAISILLAIILLLAGIGQKLWMTVAIASLSVAAAIVAANMAILPALDPYLSARPHAAFLRGDLRPDRIFTYRLNRSWNYGLAFYFRRELPEWSPNEPGAALVLTNQKGLEEITKAGRVQGELNEPQPGMLYLPISPLPR
ncbi:MAG TPA: phospholipid carrier-dependent glycosyltransferase [Candidatus Binatus sp.]|jgi:4-amino-4-deoxy-L-arabinose transferase-like glycosyltransferase|nr:phospholipid carrier-dependent glycosyltransferase [Candidatus Binatus sp.]